MKKSHFNPKELGAAPPSYSHTVAIEGPAKLVYISGQVSYGPDGAVVGKGDMKAQAEQVFGNVTQALRAAGAGWGDIVKMNAYMVGLNPASVAEYRAVRGRYLEAQKKAGQLPASTLVGVECLVDADLLLEVEVVAALAAKAPKEGPKAARAPARKAKKKKN